MYKIYLFFFAAISLSMVPNAKQRTQFPPSPSPFGYSYLEMKMMRNDLIDHWDGKVVLGVLFNINYNARFIKSDQIWLTAFVYGPDSTVIGQLQLETTGKAIGTNKDKVFGNYLMSGKTFQELIDYLKAHRDVNSIILTPEEYGAPTSVPGEILNCIRYNINPEAVVTPGGVVLLFTNEKERFLFREPLNPSPPANVSF